MSLIEIRPITPYIRLGICSIDGQAEGSPRQRERQAVLALLREMTHDDSISIIHEPSGKPVVAADGLALQGWHISVSHTKGYAVVLLSSRERVGVDIEYRSDRVESIASRFIRPDEHTESTDDKLLVWSAKEAVYKLFSEDKLLFFDMRTIGIGEHSLQIENMKRNIIVDVVYEFTDDYVLTYTILAHQDQQPYTTACD